MTDEVQLNHTLLELEALGQAMADQLEHLQVEIREQGGQPDQCESLGHLIMFAGIVHEKARSTTEKWGG